MGLRSNIKKLIGQKNRQRIRALKAQLRYRKTRRNVGRLIMRDPAWSEPVVYSLPDKHVFFGYYDIQQLSGGKMLLTAVPLKAQTRRDPAQLMWVDTQTGEYHDIATTRAWCWQQGARLRWHPCLEDTVLFNDVEGDRYVCRAADLGKDQIRTIGPAVYDITPDGRWGLSLNYPRLQRLRPGYGYDALPDHTEGETIPENDGIFLVDMDSGEQKLIVSYERLAELDPESRGQQNYVNHISVSPDGERFLFFHLWTPGVGQRWHGSLCIARLDGSQLQCVEKTFIPSHYCWRGPDELLITSVGFGGAPSDYHLYDLLGKTRVRLQNDHLERDGHPSFFADGQRFVTDTYPQDGSMQHLFIADVSAEGASPICEIYSDPRLFDEKRCDLHPRLTPDGEVITLDCTFRDGKRSVLMLRKTGKEKS